MEQKFPKAFKYRGIQQNGMIGPFKLRNGIITVQNKAEYAEFVKLNIYKSGETFELGTGTDILVDEQTGTMQKIVINRFANAFSDIELQKINSIPQDVWENDVLVNIRAIADEHAGEPPAAQDGEGDGSNEPEKPKPLPENKIKLSELQTYLEARGISYANDATKKVLYPMYVKDFNEQLTAGQ